jgi:hypothetical protein
VRLQRNALTVLEPPTGDESDFSDEGPDEGADERERERDDGGLPRVRARRPPRPLAHSPEPPPSSHTGGAVHTPGRRSGVRQPSAAAAQPVGRGDRERWFAGRAPCAPPPTLPPHLQRINFSRLETAALKRYRRFYKLPDPGPNPSKEALTAAVRAHFASVTVDETKVITMFVAAARRAASSVEAGGE